jgi:hypothetical protein
MIPVPCQNSVGNFFRFYSSVPLHIFSRKRKKIKIFGIEIPAGFFLCANVGYFGPEYP